MNNDYGNCPMCGSNFDAVFKVDTRMQDYCGKGSPLHCFSYLCGSISVCNKESFESPITDLKFGRQSNACKLITAANARADDLQAQLENVEDEPFVNHVDGSGMGCLPIAAQKRKEDKP